MMHALMTPFHYEYMLKAILISSLVGGVCACLSCFVILKGWSLMGDALAHAIIPGVAISYWLGIPFSIGAFISGISASALMGLIKFKTLLREDAIIGIVFTTYFAAGVLIISLFPSNINLKTIVFGNILGISDKDILQLIIISLVSLLVLGFKWKDLFLLLFDQTHAKAIGLNIKLLQLTLLSILAATTIAALQAVGACLVVAMLVTPGATAYLLTDVFKRMLFVAISIGVLTSFFGAYLSYFIDGATGGCIVVLQTVIFILALLMNKTQEAAA